MVPDVPTVAELAIPGFDFTLWGGFFAPAATPPEIIARINREVNQLFQRPDVIARMTGEQTEVVQNTPEQFAAFMRAETEKYRQILKDINYKEN